MSTPHENRDRAQVPASAVVAATPMTKLVAAARIPEQNRQAVRSTLLDNGLSPGMITSGDAGDELLKDIGVNAGDRIRLGRLCNKTSAATARRAASAPPLPPTHDVVNRLGLASQDGSIYGSNPTFSAPALLGTTATASGFSNTAASAPAVLPSTQDLVKRLDFGSQGGSGSNPFGSAAAVLGTSATASAPPAQPPTQDPINLLDFGSHGGYGSTPFGSAATVLGTSATTTTSAPPALPFDFGSQGGPSNGTNQELDPSLQAGLEKITDRINETQSGKIAIHTTNAALKFRRFYNKNIRKPNDKSFDEDTPDSITVKSMEYISTQSDLVSNSKFAYLKTVRSIIKYKKWTLAAVVEAEMKRMMKEYWDEANLARRTNEQNAYQTVTPKDVLHMINSALLEQQGEPLTYQQIHPIWSAIMVQNTSRRFMEFMSIAIPGMRLDSTAKGGEKRCLSLRFLYAYAKTLGFCRSEQSVGECTKVEECAVTWTLLFLQSIGVIDSALVAYDRGSLEGLMRASNYLSVEELKGLLDKAHKKLNSKQRQKLASDASDEHSSETVWDEAVKLNASSSTPKLHHWLKCDPNTQGVTSSVMTYNKGSAKLGEAGERYGYISDRRQNFSLSGARKEYEQGSFNARSSNTGVRADFITTVHAGHNAVVARGNYISDNTLKTSIPANVFRSGMSDVDATAYFADADQKRTAYMDIPGGFQEDFPKRLAELGDKREFLRMQASARPRILSGSCPVIGCNGVGHFPSDLMNHLSFVHGGRSGKHSKTTKVECPSCNDQMTLSAYYKHINERGQSPCTGDFLLNPLWNVSAPRANGNSVPPGVFPHRCPFEGCTKVYASRNSLKNHKKTHKTDKDPSKKPAPTKRNGKRKHQDTGESTALTSSLLDADTAVSEESAGLFSGYDANPSSSAFVDDIDDDNVCLGLFLDFVEGTDPLVGLESGADGGGDVTFISPEISNSASI